MGRSKSECVIVAKREQFTLSYPRHLWEDLTPNERQDVVKRQAALFDEMSQANACEGDAVGRSKVAYV